MQMMLQGNSAVGSGFGPEAAQVPFGKLPVGCDLPFSERVACLTIGCSFFGTSLAIYNDQWVFDLSGQGPDLEGLFGGSKFGNAEGLQALEQFPCWMKFVSCVLTQFRHIGLWNNSFYYPLDFTLGNTINCEIDWCACFQTMTTWTKQSCHKTLISCQHKQFLLYPSIQVE